ncbi:MAG TPA: DUF2750 domain-containing protein [bacterium]|jgi:hypothetical protein|nr:DUF2750 domain-containing protein [bacterium]
MSDALAAAPPLKPQELDQALALDPAARAEWMLEELARWEQAWGLANADGWVVFELAQAPAGKKPWALPLWPRQELAALASRGEGDTPQAVPLEELLETLLPQIAERGWLLCSSPTADGQGLLQDPLSFGAILQEAWDEYNDEA